MNRKTCRTNETQIQEELSTDYTDYADHRNSPHNSVTEEAPLHFVTGGEILCILRNPVNPLYLPLYFFVCFVSSWYPSVARAQEKPLTQAEAVALALRQSPQARVGEAVRQTALVQARRDKPVARPTLNAVVSGTAQGPRVNLPNTQNVIVPEGFGRLDLIVEQVVYHGGLDAQRRRYAAENALALEDYRKTLADLAQDARKAYLNALKAEAGLRTAQDGVAQAVRYQTLVQKQIDAGLARPADIETAKTQLLDAQEGQRQAQSGVDSAREALNYALGRPPDTPVTFAPPDALPVVPAAPDQAVAVALQSRPELVTLELNLRIAQAGVSLARSQAGPTVTARGQYSEQTPTVLNHEHSYAATLELRFPLLDGGKTRQDTQEAQAQVGRLEAERVNARKGIELSVRQAWRQLRDANARIEPARQRRLSAEIMTTVAEKAYEVGRGTAFEAQAAQNAVRSARDRELQATYDLYAAAVDFAHAQGQDIKDADAVISKKP